MSDIAHTISHLNISDKVKKDVLAIYDLIAKAESKAHGKPVDLVHFHEVGAMDAVADITAVCMLLDEIAADKIISSPIHIGKGFVKCAHGILPVPVPAVADILEGVPCYSKEQIDGELCTPTGAAILKHFATEFVSMPAMTIEKVGYGMGKKNFAIANCVRAILGETQAKADDVTELSANIDDMTGEEIGFAMDMLFETGALDVYTTAIGMKNSRPGVKLSVICKEDKVTAIEQCMFKHTTTIGIRKTKLERTVLDRDFITKDSKYGAVSFKVSKGYGVEKAKPEFKDLAKLAKANGVSLNDVKNTIK